MVTFTPPACRSIPCWWWPGNRAASEHAILLKAIVDCSAILGIPAGFYAIFNICIITRTKIRTLHIIPDFVGKYRVCRYEKINAYFSYNEHLMK